MFETNAALEQERLRAMYENGDAGSGPFWYGPYQGGYYGPSPGAGYERPYGPYNVGPNGNGGYPSAAYSTTGNNNNNVPTGMPTNNNRGRGGGGGGGGGYFEEEYYYEAGFGYPYQDPYYPFPYLDQQPNYYHGARLGR